MFQFMNYYSAIIYLAFIKGKCVRPVPAMIRYMMCSKTHTLYAGSPGIQATTTSSWA